uniref:Uncharacterized protein n=1 Tax=Oryza barthii TaxID=65489 RepID=A0A0D3FBQ4_9ORYZ
MALRRINLWKNPLLLPRPFSSSSSPIPTAPPASSIDDIRRQIESLAARGAPPGSSAASRSPPEPGEGEGRNPETSLFQEMHDRIPIAPSFHHHQLDQLVVVVAPVQCVGHLSPWGGHHLVASALTVIEEVALLFMRHDVNNKDDDDMVEGVGRDGEKGRRV